MVIDFETTFYFHREGEGLLFGATSTPRPRSGKLLMVRHNLPSVQFRSHLTAYLSNDDGQSWYGSLLLDERNGVSYPDAVEADSGKIYVIRDRGRTTDREILMATFAEDEVEQRACVTDQCRPDRAMKNHTDRAMKLRARCRLPATPISLQRSVPDLPSAEPSTILARSTRRRSAVRD